MPTAIGFKRLVIAIGAVVALCVAAIVLSSLVVSADSARDAVVAQVKAATGFEPTIRGPVSISIFPPDSVSLTDVVLGDDRSRPALAAQSVMARLRLIPLLFGRIEIADVVLVRPRISVAFQPGKHTSNWSALIDTLSRTLKPAETPSALTFSEIRINDGTVVIEHPDQNLREVLTHVEMSLAWPSISKSFGATGQFGWRTEVVEASMGIADFHAALTGETSGLKFKLAGASMKVAFDGTMNSNPTLKIDGAISADVARLRDLLRIAGRQPFTGSGFNKFVLKATIKAGDGAARPFAGQYRTRRQCGGRRPELHVRPAPQPARHAGRRKHRSHALCLDVSVSHQQCPRLEPLAAVARRHGRHRPRLARVRRADRDRPDQDRTHRAGRQHARRQP